MIKIILLLSCLALPIHANDLIKTQWPIKTEIDKSETVGFNSYKLYFKSKITNIYFDTSKKAALLDFKNKNEMVISDASDKQIVKIKAKTGNYYYKNNNYIAYFEPSNRTT